MDEQNETQAGQQYTCPDVDEVEFMTPEEAQRAVKEFDHAVQSDPKHPYRGGSPLSKDYTEYSLKLREKAAEGRENIFDKALRESREEQERKQEKLRTQAEQLFDEMDSLGFEGRERVSLEDVTDWKMDMWRMQLLNAKHDFKQLRPMIESYIQKLKFTGVDAFRNLIWDDRADPDVIAEHAALIIERIYNATEQKNKPNKKFGG